MPYRARTTAYNAGELDDVLNLIPETGNYTVIGSSSVKNHPNTGKYLDQDDFLTEMERERLSHFNITFSYEEDSRVTVTGMFGPFPSCTYSGNFSGVDNYEEFADILEDSDIDWQ